MADRHFTGSARPTETPTPLFTYPIPAETQHRGGGLWIGEPDPPAYHRHTTGIVKLLAQNVRLERVMRGWSQETLAELADLNRSFVGAIERCEHNVTLTTVEKLAKAFELTVAELLTPDRFRR